MTRDLSNIAGNLPVFAEDGVTHVIFILDRSGSMRGSQSDVIGGFNTYVDGLKAEPGAVGVSYVRFDNAVELVWNDTPLDQVPEMSSAFYEPRGNTALLDAVGMTVASVRDNPDHKYVAVVHTDGHENASREWTNEKLKSLIEERTALGNWTFAFLGCDFDAWGQADRVGVSRGNTMRYAKSESRQAWKDSAEVMNMMRREKMGSSKSYAEAIRRKMDGASDPEVERVLKDEGETP